MSRYDQQKLSNQYRYDNLYCKLGSMVSSSNVGKYECWKVAMLASSNVGKLGCWQNEMLAK